MLAATLGLAAACWVVSAWQMNGMNMGTATPLGSFGVFIAVWAAMMAAMMLPGAAPAVLRRAQAGGVRAVPLFIGSYLAVWAVAGVVVYAVDRPHGSLVAGVVTIAAGVYEFTPLKQHYRRRCRDAAGSGLGFGLCCAGSSAGLMAVLVALGVMSVTWMVVIAVIVLAQKLLPPIAGRGCAGGSGDHRARGLDRGEPRVGARPCPADVRCRVRHRPRSIVLANKNKSSWQ